LSPLAKLSSFLTSLWRGGHAHDVAFPVALGRSLNLYLRQDFSVKEILGFALYVPGVRVAFPVLISKEASLRKLSQINSTRHLPETEAKDIFHLICARNALPVPEVIGWTCGGEAFDDAGGAFADTSSWIAYLADRLPKDFIVKDRAGAYGSGFRAFCRDGAAFVSVDDGRRLELASLATFLRKSDLIIQQRLFDDPRLEQLSGRRGLQTARINTLLHEDGSVEVLFWMLKILGGRTTLDNFSMGSTGNLIGIGDRRDLGVLRAAVTLHSSGSGLVRIANHPATGLPFDGFRIPWWSEAVELVRRAQQCFPALPALGWDVALTAAGPRIIEANAQWDPPNYAPELLSPRHWRAIFGESGDIKCNGVPQHSNGTLQ